MSYASFGSTKLDPRVSAPEPEPEGQDSLGTSLRKGWSSGLDSLGANANQLAGLAGEAAGADGFAKNRYAAAKTLRESAEMGAPQISSLDQIDGVGNALRYGAGQLGALAPIALGVTGASLATGNPLVGGALAMGVPEAGDIAYRQTQDPGVAGMGAGERLARAGAGGLASGVVQSAGPGMLMGKFAAPGKELVRRSMPAIVGQNLASGVGVNAGASAGSEAIKQIATNTDAPLNTGAIGEAAAAGAVMGLPFGAAGAGVDLVRSSPGKSWIGAKGLAQDGVQAAKDGVQAAKDGVPSTEDLVSKLRDIGKPATDMADSIMNSQTMSDAKEFAGKTTDQVSAALKERAGKTADLSVKLGNELLNRSGLSDEHQATIREAMSNVGDTANQIKIATIAKSLKAKDYATEKVSKAYDKVSEAYKKMYRDDLNKQAGDFLKETEGQYGVKKSEDYSGLENLIYEKVAPMIEDAKPEFLENPENINKLGGTLRMFLRAAADGKDLRVAGIHTSISDMLGHDLAHDVLNAAHEYATGGDQAKVSSMMKALSEQLRDKAGNESLTQIIKKSQSAEAPARTGVTDSPEQLAGIIRDWARGEYSKGKSRSQIEYHDEVMKQFLRQHFGTKADRVLAAAQKEVEGEAKRASGKTEARTDSDERTGDLSEKRNDASDSEYGTTNDREVKTFYHEGKDGENKLYEQSPETVSKHGSALEQALAKQREEHPNHKVHFVKLRDYAKAHDLDEAAMLKLTGGKDPGSYGFIKHDLIDGSDKLEPHQLRGMRGEIRSAIHPDAIGVEGRTIQYDSRRIANVMHESAKDEWSDMENAHGMRGRMAQKFAEGIAKLTEHEGANLKVRDDHVIARINGKDMTWGEAKEILKNPDTIKAPEHMRNASRAEQKLHDFIPELDDAHISRLMNEATFRRDGLTEPIKAEIEAAVKKEMGRAKYGSNKSDQVYREVQRRLKEATADEATGIPKLERVIRSLENEKDRRAGEDRRTSVMDTGMETREGIALNKGKMGVLESTQHTSDVRLDTLLGEKSGSAAQVADARTKSQAAQLGMTDLSGKVGKRGRDTGIGSGRMEGDPEGQIHDAVATVNRSDLERHTPSVGGRMADGKDLILKASKIRQTDSPMKEGLAKRLETLAVNMTMMTKEDQAALHAVMHLTSPVDLKAAIDPIARKYADRIAPPKGDIGGLMGPGDKRSTVKGKLADRSVQEGVARMDDITHQAFGVDDPGPMPMRETGSTPNPKAVAAKKAAFLERAASGDEGLIKEVSTSDDAKGLQRAAQALDGKPGPVLDAINARLSELVQDPQTALGMQTKKYSLDATKAAGTPLTAKGKAQIEKYIHDVLGNSVMVDFPFLPHAGEFANNVVSVSVHALNPTTVAYHESLHALFKQLKDKGLDGANKVVEQAASKPAVTARLRELLAHSPDALAQLKDAEERAAYMYQFWANGDAKLIAAMGEKSTNLFTRITDALKKVIGIWTNDQHAVHIMEYFSSGEYAKNMNDKNAVYKGLNQDGPVQEAYAKLKSMSKGFMEMGDAVWGAGSSRLRDSGIPALGELADMIKKKGTAVGRDAGFIPAARIARADFMHKLAEGLGPMEETMMRDAMEALQQGKAATTPEGLKAQAAIRGVLDDVFDYLGKAGVKVNDLGYGKDYFPRHWDSNYLSKHKAEFMAMARKYPDWHNPEDTYNKLIANDGAELRVADRPGFSGKKERVLSFIDHADAAPFMSKNLLATVNGYITQATRRAEWARRFNDDNTGIEGLLVRARKEGASEKDIDHAQKFLAGVNGTLGDDLNPTMRRYMGNMIVYQNVRLLPLAIFSSVVDPMGIAVRGGTVGDAFKTFVRGIKEVPAGLKGKQITDHWTQMAEALGTIDNATLSHSLGALYTQGMVDGTARKINDTFFRFNLMEQFNNSMRVGATEASLKFMAKHADGKASMHSARWMNELGLSRGDIKVDKDGHVLTTVADGLTEAQAARVKRAVNQWVDGAVLRPDAADKPTWMNDPHFMLVSHLKQFVYSFQHTILDRVVHEFKNGNYQPAMAMASYIPIMIAADMLKGFIMGGGSQPGWKAGWGVSDYLESGIERAGLFGVGQFGIDALTGHAGTLVGPTLEQFGQAVAAVQGPKQFAPMVIHALPANALYSGYVRGASVPDPVHFE